MRRFTAAQLITIGLTVASLAGARTASGQTGGAAGSWNDARSRALVELATKRRAEQLADTGLADYRATARGYVTFLAQLGDGFLETPKLVKTDQLALEVYWAAPNLSKQRIIGRRDTLLLPTDIQYHRDHLGIVQNNFPDFIRLGDGDEVRDVPHPLSPAGLRLYDYMISDSVRIRAGTQEIDLIEVKIRPKEDRDPRVIGAVYLEPVGAQVVRMAFNFTRAAFLDAQLEDLAIVLENRLVGSRFWLPSRQQIEIRRRGTWMDYPVRGIIRGWWEIDQYQFNLALPRQMFSGSEIVLAPAQELRQYPWQGAITDSLPADVRATVDPDIQRIQNEARTLVRARALERVQAVRLSARRASDFVRINRVEGFSIGAGFSARLVSRLSFTGRARVANDDHQVKGLAALRWDEGSGSRVELFASRDLVDIGDQAERSSVVNSVAAQELGSDLTDPFSFATGGIRLMKRFGGFDAGFRVAGEEHRQVHVNALASNGSYEPTPRITPLRGVRATVTAERPLSEWAERGQLRFDASISGLRSVDGDVFSNFAPRGLTSVRASVGIEHRSTIGRATLILTEHAAAMSGGGSVPLQEAVYFGGPVSLPGYNLHDVAGRYGLATRAELRVPVPFIAIPLGRFGQVPGRAQLAPYLGAAVVGGSVSCAAGIGRCPSLTEGVYPSVGIGLLTVYDLLRFDVARGLRNGRWMFNVDVNRDFWSIL